MKPKHIVLNTTDTRNVVADLKKCAKIRGNIFLV
jgi:hypothetical protein